MQRTIKLVTGLFAGAALSLAPIGVSLPAVAAVETTAPVAAPSFDLPARHIVIFSGARVSKKNVDLHVWRDLPDGGYLMTFGYLTGKGSIAAMRSFVIKDGKVVAGEGRTNERGHFLTRIPLDEMRSYTKNPADPQGLPTNLKRFPRADYAMVLVNISTGTFYEVRLDLDHC